MILKVINPEKIIFEGEVESVSFPTPTGKITVLSHHDALVTSLIEGEIKIIPQAGEPKKFLGGESVFETSNNQAVMLLRNYHPEN
jgi:F-type H+-transporting ATPase subunit epsilon